jgi:hypothetical protein
MRSILLALTSFPAALLASPTIGKSQDVLDSFDAPRTMALAKTKVKVTNLFPVDTMIGLLHWRGRDNGTLQRLAWDYTFPEDDTVPIDVPFETSLSGIVRVHSPSLTQASTGRLGSMAS